MERVPEPASSVAFGRFRVVPHRRELLADGRPIKLGGRAFDVLLTLIEARGAVVSKGALMARVWPDRIAEENNLQAQISALRAAFGRDRDLIRTVSGRGYQFTAEMTTASAEAERELGARAASAKVRPPTNLPEPVSELIGRDDHLGEVLSLVAGHRLVTLAGAGGIGKTRLALAVASQLLPDFADGVWVAELAPLSDRDLVPTTVATALRLELTAPTPETVANAVSDKQVLLVLDNCEHLIDATAMMAEALMHANQAAHVIATSREPLKAEGEWIYPLPPLAVPAQDAENEDNPLHYGAVQLFVERARALAPHFVPDRHNAAGIAAICRRLDGIPLAIELAAARAAALGIEALAARLDDRFQVLTGGRRTALPRHQTLRATLDWSYELLGEPERVILHRLAIFAGSFSLEAAIAVATGADIAPPDVIDGIANLVAKSLVSMEVDRNAARYRLLDTMRAYAQAKLAGSGELGRIARSHAEYYRSVFQRAEIDLEARPVAEWLADHRRRIDNLRAALDWAFSPAGDAATGVALTVAAVPIWTHLSLMHECRDRVEQALVSLRYRTDCDKHLEMRLAAALGAALMYTRGATPETRAAFSRALEIADTVDDTDYRLRALWGLWVDRMNEGAVRDAVRLAERFTLVASSSADPIALSIGERTMGFALHFLGDQANAARHIERMFGGYVPKLHDRPIIRFQFDPWVTARMRFAVILWLQGYPDHAREVVESCLDEALAINHAVTLCNGVAQGACPIALLTGDLDAAERSVALLFNQAERAGLSFWQADARCFKGVLLIRRGDLARGIDTLRNALDEFSRARLHTRYDAFLGELAEALGRLGDVSGGLTVLDGALDLSERTGGRWYVAELLRIRGALVMLRGESAAPAEAEDCFRQALEWARGQSALSWELRAATSLAQLMRDQGRAADARALLQPVYDRFTEGFGTADLKAAKELLDAVA